MRNRIEVHTGYFAWLASVVTEYIARTGRAYPPAYTEAGQNLRIRIVNLSNNESLTPSDVVTILMDEGLLKG